MSIQLCSCPICGTQAEKNTFCPTCQWFLVGSLDAVSLSPIPQADLDAINASLKAYRQGWQARKEQQKEKENAELREILKELKSLRAAVTALEKRAAPAPAPVQAPLVVPAARPVSEPAISPSPSRDFMISGNTLIKYTGKGTDVTIPDGIQIIGAQAFQKSEVHYVYIPDSVTEIGEMAFDHCNSLKKVRMSPNLRVLGKQAFWCCSYLERIDIPAGVSDIPYFCFAGCTNMTEITLTEGLHTIGTRAFYLCRKIKNMHIPKSMTQITDQSLEGCDALQASNSLYLPRHMDNPAFRKRVFNK